jgi:hypothetical protein
MTNIKITGVYPGTEKQVQANIHGTVNLSIEDDKGNVIVYLNGLMVRKTGSGDFFLAPPSKEAGKNEDGSRRFINYYKLFPGKEDVQTNRSAALMKDVMNELNNSASAPAKTAEASNSLSW